MLLETVIFLKKFLLPKMCCSRRKPSTIKPHSPERLRVRLRQIANIASMGCIKRKEEWVLHQFFAFDATSSLTQCYHLDANIDARVNGP